MFSELLSYDFNLAHAAQLAKHWAGVTKVVGSIPCFEQAWKAVVVCLL